MTENAPIEEVFGDGIMSAIGLNGAPRSGTA
jgi:cyanate lyase